MITADAQALHVEALLGKNRRQSLASIAQARNDVIPSLVAPRITLEHLARRFWARGGKIELPDGSDLAEKLAGVPADLVEVGLVARIVKHLGEHDAATSLALKEIVAGHFGLAPDDQDIKARKVRRDAATRLAEIVADPARERRLLNVHEERFLLEVASKWGFDDAASPQERELGRTAYHELMLRNLRLVWNLVRKIMFSRNIGCLDQDDLFQSGCMGLARAIRKFNPELGTRLSTYATLWIKQFMARTVMDDSLLISIPTHVQDKNRLEARADKEGAAAGESVAIPIPRVVDLGTRSGEDDAGGPWEALADDSEPPPVILERAERARLARELLAGLSAREQDILARRFGLDRPDGQTLEEIGAVHGVSRERIRQVEAGALKRLQRRYSHLVRQIFDVSRDEDGSAVDRRQTPHDGGQEDPA